MRKTRSSRHSLTMVILTAGLLLAACGGDGDGGGGTTELTFAHSFTTEHPHHRCGAQPVADKLNSQDVGLTVNVFPNSQLGGDADRFSSVISGDVDIDLQGSSALSATYAPIGMLDRAYVFDGPDHLFEFFDGEGSKQLLDDFRAKTGARALDVWYTGMRHFTANQPIRTPDDLKGLRMRFPDSPIYLQNAEALGASATAVAFEEVFISLQQGIIDGQENPISNIASLNLPEVQSHLSLSGHGTGSVVAVVSEKTWEQLTSEQQEALTTAIRETRAENRTCIEDDDQKFLQEWQQSGAIEVVEDVDRAAFQQRTEAYYDTRLQGADRELYDAIRSMAPDS